jgi:hypothetical protein
LWKERAEEQGWGFTTRSTTTTTTTALDELQVCRGAGRRGPQMDRLWGWMTVKRDSAGRG